LAFTGSELIALSSFGCWRVPSCCPAISDVFDKYAGTAAGEIAGTAIGG
jgi:hypothetical protein